MFCHNYYVYLGRIARASKKHLSRAPFASANALWICSRCARIFSLWRLTSRFVSERFVGANVEDMLLFEHAVRDLLLSSYYLRTKLLSSQ